MRPILTSITAIIALASVLAFVEGPAPLTAGGKPIYRSTSCDGDANNSILVGASDDQKNAAVKAVEDAGGRLFSALNLECRRIGAKEMVIIAKNIRFLPKINRISISEVDLNDEFLTSILEMPNLQWLSIGRSGEKSQLTKNSLVKFTLAKRLTNLTWYESNIDDQGLIFISTASSLERLVLWKTKATDVGVIHLRKLENLTELCLESNMTDEGLKTIGKMVSLESLDLPGSQITAKGLKELASLPNLSMINLRWTKIGDEAMPVLASFASLREIQLQRTALTNEGLKVLANLQNIRHLNLSETRVTNDGIQKLTSMTGLVTLNVAGTRMTERGAAALMKARPGLQVSYR